MSLGFAYWLLMIALAVGFIIAGEG